MKQYGWGIIGLGSIARRFMNDLPRCPQARLAAVASRSMEKAREFADEYHFERCYGSYDELLQDPAVDIVYLAVPHPLHQDLAIRAMEAGKAVLCEKPVSVSAVQARAMVDCARRNKTFFMEAMWTRFFPVNQRIKQLIGSGSLGAVTLIEVDFGFGNWNQGHVANPQSRLYAPELAGGSLLDVGVYCVSYATWLKGERPVRIKALATPLATGVDGITTCLFQYADGAMAVMHSSVVQNTRQEAKIYCEHGMIEVPAFWHPSRAAVHYQDSSRPDEVIEIPYQADGATGFNFEAEVVMACLDQGLTENPDMTWLQSIEVMELLDDIRGEIGLRFPFEQ